MFHNRIVVENMYGLLCPGIKGRIKGRTEEGRVGLTCAWPSPLTQ